MNRRKFLKLSVGAFSLPLLIGKGSLALATIKNMRSILTILFPEDIISLSIENNIDDALRSFPAAYRKYAPFTNFDANIFISLTIDANKISKNDHNIDFGNASVDQQKFVVDKLMKNTEHLNTYRSLRDVLFGDPIYILNNSRVAWQYLHYTEHMYNDAPIVNHLNHNKP